MRKVMLAVLVLVVLGGHALAGDPCANADGEYGSGEVLSLGTDKGCVAPILAEDFYIGTLDDGNLALVLPDGRGGWISFGIPRNYLSDLAEKIRAAIDSGKARSE